MQIHMYRRYCPILRKKKKKKKTQPFVTSINETLNISQREKM